MPISLGFLDFARPAFAAIRLIRFEPKVQWRHQRARDAGQAMLARELCRRLPPHLMRDVLPDGD